MAYISVIVDRFESRMVFLMDKPESLGVQKKMRNIKPYIIRYNRRDNV